jgi:hypothetical protein
MDVIVLIGRIECFGADSFSRTLHFELAPSPARLTL